MSRPVRAPRIDRDPRRLRALRDKHGWTQQQLSDVLGRTVQNVQALETGDRLLTPGLALLVWYIDKHGPPT